MSESIGTRLKQAREAKRLTLEQVADATRVRTHYLDALERDDMSSLPSAAQGRGFLRIYADFLGLDSDSLMPVARPTEPVSQPVAPLSSVSAAPAQETSSAPSTSRPNLLNSLRDRFARRTETTEPIVPAASAESLPEEKVESVESEARHEPEEEPFVPVRYTEELPAEPQPIVEEEAVPSVLEPTKPVRRKTTPRKVAGKKPAAKQAKSTATGAGKKTGVKKKIMLSRPKKKSKSRTKRASLPRKPSSSRPRRPSPKAKKPRTKLKLNHKSKATRQSKSIRKSKVTRSRPLKARPVSRFKSKKQSRKK